MDAIPIEVIDGIKAVREGGGTNMFDRSTVADQAESLGFDSTADWVRDSANSKTYSTFLMTGVFAPGGEIDS